MSRSALEVEAFYLRERHPETFHRAYFGDHEYVGQISFLSRSELLELGSRLQLGPDALLLDIGCGIGGPAILLARHYGCRVVGVDLNADNIAAATKAALAAGVETQVNFRRGDWRNLFRSSKALSGRFDAAIMIDSLVHFEDCKALFEGLRSLAADGARLGLATEIIRDGIEADDLAWRERSGHVRCIRDGDIGAELAAAGWTVTHMDTIPGRRGDFANFCLSTGTQYPDLDHLAAIARISETDLALEVVIYGVADNRNAGGDMA